MKTMTRILCIAGCVSALGLTTAYTQPYPNEVWTFDENGLGLLDGPIVGYVNGTLAPDPVSGMVTLYYNWGQPTFPGDVVLLEPDTLDVSDILRFDGLGGMYFFSEQEPGEIDPDLADVPVLPDIWTAPAPPVFLDEVGPEGNNGAFYTPLPGEPGYDTSGVFQDVSYNFISDVPEPTALALLGLGSLALVMGRRRHTKA